MIHNPDGYQVLPFPLSRQVVVDAVRVGSRKHTIHGLIEADVTDARRLIREHRARTGEALSFTAFILACLGRAIDADRRLHAYRDWRNRLIVFDDVDVSSIIEVEAEDGHTFPLAHVFRAANRRTIREIHEEIRAVQHDRAAMQAAPNAGVVRWLMVLPPFARDLFYGWLSRSPRLLKRHVGTVVLTAVGMFGTGGGWGLPILSFAYNLGVTLGGIAERPGVVEGRIEAREYLCITVSFNHDLIDGGPAARFTQRFKELIERGEGLAEAVGG